ncbi:MAG TPA: glycosyltransferase family 39 protein [Candidatus Eisenbacteria bacterium]
MTAETDRRPALGALLVAAGMILVAAFAWLSRPSAGAPPFHQYELEFLYRIPRGEAGFYLRYLALGLPAVLLLGFGVSFLTGRSFWDRFLARLDAVGERFFVAVIMVTAALLVLGVARFILHDQPVTDDERVYLFQADLLSRGHLYLESQPLREFYDNVFIVNNGKWYGKYPPGHPLFLVPGVVAGFPRIVPALLAALNVLLLYRLAGFYFSRRLARAAALLLLLSPFFLFTGATLLSHTSCLTMLLLFAWAAHRSMAGGNTALVAGAAVGMAFLIRPYTALIIGLPVAAAWFLALRRRGAPLKPWLTALGTASLFAIALLVVNQQLTGNPFRTGYAEVQGDRGRVLGFGEVIPGRLEHTPASGLLNVLQTIVRLNFWSFGWPLGWLFVVAALLWSRRRDLLPLWGILVVTALGSVLYFSLGVSDTGPVKYYELLPVMVLLTVAGAASLNERIGRAGRPGLSGLAPALIAALTLVGWGLFGRVQAAELGALTNRIAAPYRQVAQLPTDQRLLIFASTLQRSPFDSWVFSTPNNVPESEARVLYVRDRGKDNRAIIERMADRAPYVLQKNEDQRFELTRLSGDEASRRMVEEREREAIAHLRKLEIKEAIDLLAQASKLDPNRAKTYLLLGWACEQGRLAGPAETAYRKALELDKNNPDHYFFLGRFLGRANRLDEALPLLEAAVRANPRQKDYATALGQVRSGVPPP